MINWAMVTKPGGREVNEDYVTMATHDESYCFVLCDGLGGHECGDLAATMVADKITDLFSAKGDYAGFIDDAINQAQFDLLKYQSDNNLMNSMKTTLALLIVTKEQIKWAHVGDSRVYRFYNNNSMYERTKDHSLVQLMKDQGEISEEDIRHHIDRNKILKAMGAELPDKFYTKSAILERENSQRFALMSDGFWENIVEADMMDVLRKSQTADEWLTTMTALVEEKADLNVCDNYSAICVYID